MISRFRMSGKRKGFTLVELLVVIAIIAVLASLLLPAVQKVREAANRSKCSNNMRQLALGALSFESAFKGLPRAGEHIAPGNNKCQDYQSNFVVILPYIDQGFLFNQYDMSLRYNQDNVAGVATAATVANPTQGNNSNVAGYTPPIFYCPTNPLNGDRVGGTRDQEGFGCVDYMPIAYTQMDSTGAWSSSNPLYPAAMCGNPYPTSLYMTYPTPTSTSAYPGSPFASTVAASSLVKPSKLYQLIPNMTPNNFSFAVDPNFGLSTIASITDGTSNTALYFEDVGMNDNNINTTTANQTAQSYPDVINSATSCQWRWANPDCASGQNGKLNQLKNATYTTPDPSVGSGGYAGQNEASGYTAGATWGFLDEGMNSEGFSFHGNGANVAFADGHVTFVRDSVSTAVLRALITKNQGANEVPVDLNVD